MRAAFDADPVTAPRTPDESESAPVDRPDRDFLSSIRTASSSEDLIFPSGRDDPPTCLGVVPLGRSRYGSQVGGGGAAPPAPPAPLLLPPLAWQGLLIMGLLFGPFTPRAAAPD